MADVTDSSLEAIFPGDSEMSRLMRAHDWAATPLGDPRGLARGARTSRCGMMLTSRFEMWLGWGDDLASSTTTPTRRRSGSSIPPCSASRSARYGPKSMTMSSRIASVHARRHADLGQGAAAAAGAQRLSRGDLPHLLLQPAAWATAARSTGLMCVVTEETERVDQRAAAGDAGQSRPFACRHDGRGTGAQRDLRRPRCQSPGFSLRPAVPARR